MKRSHQVASLAVLALAAAACSDTAVVAPEPLADQQTEWVVSRHSAADAQAIRAALLDRQHEASAIYWTGEGWAFTSDVDPGTVLSPSERAFNLRYACETEGNEVGTIGWTECDTAAEAEAERQALIANGYEVTTLEWDDNDRVWFFEWRVAPSCEC